MPAELLAERKKDLVNQINGFISMKKDYSQAQHARTELITGSGVVGGGQEEDVKGDAMSASVDCHNVCVYYKLP
jgi:hypothetical protein